jgi:hypothetical protein
MQRWVKHPTISAERLVRPSAQHELHHCFTAALVVVAVFGASPAPLHFLVLVRFVAELLAVVALPRPWPVFERACRARLSAGVEEAFCDEPPCIASLSHVHYHGSVRLRDVSLAQPRDLGNRRSVFFAKSFCCSCSNPVRLIQQCCSLNVVDLDREEFIPQHARACADLLRCSLDKPMLVFVSARDPDPALGRVVDGDRPASPVFVVLHRAHFLFHRCSDHTR